MSWIFEGISYNDNNLFLNFGPMHTVWRHNLCLSFGKISPCAAAAGSVLYLQALSPPGGGAQCLSVIKVFMEKRPNCFNFMWHKVWVVSNICDAEVFELRQRRALSSTYLHLCTAC